jgi:hypothetical protein
VDAPASSASRADGWRRVRRHGSLVALAVAALSLYGFWLRRIHLTDLFDAWYFDEVNVFADVLNQLRGTAPHTPYAINYWRDRLTLYEWGAYYVLRRFGTTDEVMGLVPVAWGTLCIPLTYLLARELELQISSSLLAAGLLATSLWHVELSRMLYDNVAVCTWAVACCWLTVGALRRGSFVWSAAAGLAAGAVLLGYIGGRVIILVGTAWAAYLLVVHGPLLRLARRTPAAPPGFDRPDWRLPLSAVPQALVFLVATFAVIAPGLRYYDTVMGRPMIFDPHRSSWVFVLGPHGVDDFREKTRSRQMLPVGDATLVARLPAPIPALVRTVWQPTDESVNLEILRYQLSRVPLIFTHSFDEDLMYHRPVVPLLDPVSLALFLPAFVYCLVRWRRPGTMLLVLWVTITLVMSQVLTIDTPNAMRGCMLFPYVYLVIAELVDAVTAAVFRRAPGPWVRGVVFAALALWVVGVGEWTLRTYYQRYAVEDPISGPAHNAFAATWTRLVNRLGGSPTVVLYVDEPFSFGWRQVYVPAARVVDATKDPSLGERETGPVDVVVFADSNDAHIARWHERYPALWLEDRSDRSGHLLFTIGFTQGPPALRPAAIAPAEASSPSRAPDAGFSSAPR